MRYAQIRAYDVANGEGIRCSIFFSGCEHYCEGCFNKEYWDFNYGKEITDEVINTLIDNVDKPHVKGLSVLGGEPLHPKNIVILSEIVAKFRYEYTNTKDIWIWTGYTYEELKARKCKYTDYILSEIDVLIDGKFDQSKKDLTLKFKGSSNQRLIDMKATSKHGELVYYLN